MFEINEPLYLWVPSQVFGVVALFFMCWAFLSRDKSRVLTLKAVAFGFIVLSLGFLQNWVLMGIITFALVRNILFIRFEREPERFSTVALVTIIILSLMNITVVVVVAMTIGHWWLDWVLLAFSLAFNLAVWAQGTTILRIVGLSYVPIIVYNHVVHQNFVGIILEIIIGLSIIVYFARSFAKAKARENLVDGCLGGTCPADLPQSTKSVGNVDSH